MRPVRAAAPSPGQRPGFFMDANLTPCKGKSFLDVFKAFALTGRFFCICSKTQGAALG